MDYLHLANNRLTGCLPDALPSRTYSDLPTCPASPEAAADRDALIAFYESTDGENWLNNDNWLSDKPIGEWHGVYTDGDGRVVELGLVENGLSGEIPPEIGDFAHLGGLDLSGNQLSGAIPPTFGNLSNLVILYLNDNQLSGEIPPELGDLANLDGLSLAENELSGEIPPELGDLSILSHLELSGNQLTDCVPSELRNRMYSDSFCPSPDREALVALYESTDGANWKSNGGWLSDAPISEWFGVYVDENYRVIELSLTGNGLVGEIPAEIGDLSHLVALYLYNNHLTGEIPPEIGNLSRLRWLLMSGNHVSGEIPTEIGDLSNLVEMSIYNNRLSGEIPPEIGDLSNLVELTLDGNNLSGEIPPEIGNLSKLVENCPFMATI